MHIKGKENTTHPLYFSPETNDYRIARIRIHPSFNLLLNEENQFKNKIAADWKIRIYFDISAYNKNVPAQTEHNALKIVQKGKKFILTGYW